MANTRLFDSWQIGMDLPAPFDRAIDGGVRYSTKEEDCSCYNKATRGKKATLFPVVLRAVLNLMRGGLNDGNIAAFYCISFTFRGSIMDTRWLRKCLICQEPLTIDILRKQKLHILNYYGLIILQRGVKHK